MAEIARCDRQDTVASPDGTGDCCAFPTVQHTDEGSSDFFVGGFGVVRQGDAMTTHNNPDPECCTPHTPRLEGGSATFFVNGKPVARKGDSYGGDHPISSGDSTFIVG